MRSPAEETKFRVSVCLEQFFSDERARCFVSVSPEQPVRWLCRRLRRLFPLPRRLALLSQGHLLPSDEPLSLLSPNDVIQVIQANVDMDVNRDDNIDSHVKAAKMSTPENPKCQNTQISLSQPNSPSVALMPIEVFNGPNPLSITLPHETQDTNEVTTSASSPNSKEFSQHSESAVKQHYHDDDVMITVNSANIDPLIDMKKQALALLDNYTGPHRRRRRIRRRRPRSSVAEQKLPAENQSAHFTENIATATDAQTNSENCMELETVEISIEASKSSLGESIASPLDVYTSLSPSASQTFTWIPCSPPQVLQNDASAPRVPRVVRPLSNGITINTV